MHQTFIFTTAFLVFASKLGFLSCHVKDLGEKNATSSHILEEFEDRILGGDDATLNDYPFNVQFFNFGGLCGGSILTSKTVLTAAHCFDYNTNIGEMKVVSNALYVRHDRKSRVHEVWDFLLHEQYNNPKKYANDMALIIIHDSFAFSSTVKKAVLTNSASWTSEKKSRFVATGWGVVEMAATRRLSLQKTNLRYVPSKECSDLSGLQLIEGMFCLFGDEERDTCRGDSGGGILWNNVVVGVVSHGIGCLKLPSVYMDVFYFKPWIEVSVKKLYFRYYKFHKGQQHKKKMKNGSCNHI